MHPLSQQLIKHLRGLLADLEAGKAYAISWDARTPDCTSVEAIAPNTRHHIVVASVDALTEQKMRTLQETMARLAKAQELLAQAGKVLSETRE